MIIWLDMHIGSSDYCQHLKASFSSINDPKNETPVKLVDKDYDEILRVEGPLRVNFEGVWFLLSEFTNIERCIKCFEQNQNKRIFFITSGAMGEVAVPRILERFKETFTDQVSNEPYMSMYVFCLNIGYHIEWALNYREYIQIFDHEADLLSRMTRDIGNYFVTQGKYLLVKVPPNNDAAYHRLSWAHELYQRYSKMEKEVSMKKELDEVNGLLEKIEKERKSSSDEDE
jgi:hypothetical protein